LTYNTILDKSKTFVVIGGLGGVGTSLAKWMVSRGARRIVLVSRSNKGAHKSAPVISKLESQGASVKVMVGDVTRYEDVDRIFSNVDGVIGGVVHAAMVLDVCFRYALS
jgi:NAD(P)-dependent dehydrogenase (short-subunit alcohol dehydrogenase family)